ncbi:MAG: beta-ketoacyl synthase chain length factor [Rhodocyclaceae bacterium]|nr:beta-ketoacyl synthase chain length factor [Rhodocyclaceae bacterium]
MTAAHPAPLHAWIDGIGLICPGLPSWQEGRAVLAGETDYQLAASVLPVPSILPPAERRRASRIVKLSLAIGFEAVANAAADASQLMTVFSSSSGDGQNCDALCEALASDDRQVSPTRFTNSVHNTAAGFWGIAAGATPASQVLCAYDGSFGAGLLEAMALVAQHQAPVLLFAYEAEYSGALHLARPLPDAAGIALLLQAQPTAHSLARIAVSLGDDADAQATRLAIPALETLRTAIPALRGLPLLAAIACQNPATVLLDYLSPLQLQLDVQPC